MAFEQVLPRRLSRWVAAEPDWEQVYAEQLPRVFNFFRYRFGDTADAEDLTARTFEKAWRARHRYHRDVAGFATWLLTIARNVAIDHMRARHHHEPIETATAVAASGNTPEQTAVQLSEAQRLGMLLGTLPPRQLFPQELQFALLVPQLLYRGFSLGGRRHRHRDRGAVDLGIAHGRQLHGPFHFLGRDTARVVRRAGNSPVV